MLDHPNLVKCFGVGVVYSQFSAALLIVMERMDCSLEDYLTNFGCMSELPQLANFTAQILSGLNYLHERGVT